MRELTLAVDAKAILGEGPSWDSILKCLYWVDIPSHKLHIYYPQTKEQRDIQLNEFVTSAVPGKPGEVILTLQHGFHKLNLKTEQLTELVWVENDKQIRFNDGKCDPAGRYWAGTMAVNQENFRGSLYCLDTDLNAKQILSEVSISNGLAWSSDYRTMYYIDTPTREVVAYRYQVETGEISNPRVVVRIAEDAGFPDGMTIDSEDMLWIAHWDGGRISRWNPNTGQLLEEIRIPASRVTSCVFAGDELTELYITTAREGLDEETLKSQPYAGGLFHLKTNVKGTPTFRFETPGGLLHT